MFNNTLKTSLVAVLATATMFTANAQAHTVTVTPKGAVRVTDMDTTTKVVYSQYKGFNRVKVTSLRDNTQTDGSIKVFELTTVIEIRINKCNKRAKKCVQRRISNGSRLVQVLPAPIPEPVLVVQPAAEPDRDCNVAVPTGKICPQDGGTDPVTVQPTTPGPTYPKPVLHCTFPDSWIIPTTPGYEFISTGIIWCEVRHNDGDPVRVRAVSPETEPARFVPTDYAQNYSAPCPSDSSCFRSIYALVKPGAYNFTVTATSDSGQEATVEGSSSINEGYPSGNK